MQRRRLGYAQNCGERSFVASLEHVDMDDERKQKLWAKQAEQHRAKEASKPRCKTIPSPAPKPVDLAAIAARKRRESQGKGARRWKRKSWQSDEPAKGE